MKKLKNIIYIIGVIITFLGLAGISESFTGHGSTFAGLIWLSIGLLMILFSYTKTEDK